jgi:hypothetical protein
MIRALLLLAVLVAPAHAQVCNPPDGTRALLRAQIGFTDHRPVICGQHDCRGQYVTPEGFLHPCPKPPEPVLCLPKDTPERWGGPHGDACTSLIRGSSTSMNQRLGLGAQGGSWLILDEEGNDRGMQLWRCTATGWRVEGERCAVRELPPAPPKAAARKGGDAKVGTVPRAPGR